MKQSADAKRRNESFDIGDLVYLKLRPYQRKSFSRRPFEKLVTRFYGPFPIINKVGTSAYTLELPPSSKIHPAFHVSQLKHAVGDELISPTIPKELNSGISDSTRSIARCQTSERGGAERT